MRFLVLHLSWRLLSDKLVILYSRVPTAFAPCYQRMCLFSLKVGGVIPEAGRTMVTAGWPRRRTLVMGSTP
jgi:hypothetical protein